MDARSYLAALEAEGHLSYAKFKKYRVDLPSGSRGPWTVRKFTTMFDMQYARYARDGRPPGLGEFTQLLHDKRGCVMSDTCPEVEDLLNAVEGLHGDVLITGLGLGMAIRALTKIAPYKKRVNSITVIEKEADVISLVAPSYVGKKVKVVHADALLWKPPRGTKFDSAWHDIWDDGDRLEEHAEIKRKYRNFVSPGGQFCWGKMS